MCARNNLVKATLVLGTVIAGAWIGISPVFAQASALDRLLEQADSSNVVVDELSATEQSKSETDAAESEAAMLMLTEALAADRMTDVFISAESEAATAVQKRPGAAALGNLESVGLESLATAPNARDLQSAGAAFTVDTASVPALQAALNSEQALTQLYAADALWTLTGDSNLILPTLMQAAESEDPDIQALAVMALRQMGDEASPAVPVLIELLDRDSQTRLIAQDALTVIRSENRSEAVLGIIARESQRRLLPAALRAITGLWR